MYLLYNLVDGKLLDRKQSQIGFYKFAKGYTYLCKTDYSKGLTYIFKIIDNKIEIDSIPEEKVNHLNNYLYYYHNDSARIYHIPTNRVYNLGLSEDYAFKDSFFAIKNSNLIFVYNIGDSVNVIGRITSDSNSKYLDMSAFDNYLTFYGTQRLFHFKADSIWQVANLPNDVSFRDWFFQSNGEFFSIENYNDGSWEFRREIKGEILRCGWCFKASDGGGYEIDNIKSVKRLIKESFLDKKTQENLCDIIDKHYSNILQ